MNFKLSSVEILILSAMLTLSGCHDHHRHHHSTDPDSQSEQQQDEQSNDNSDGSSEENTDTDTDGDEDGDEDENQTISAASEVHLTLSGQVLDGYWIGANVCLDLNQDFACNDDEPMVLTQENGNYSIDTSIKAEKLKNTAYSCLASSTCSENAAIRVLAEATDSTSNITLGSDTALAKKSVMSSFAFLEEQEIKNDVNETKYGFARITPYTTIATLSYDPKNGADSVSTNEFSNKMAEIAGSFGLDPAVLQSDYNDPKNITEQSQKALVTGELMVRSGLIPETLEDLSARSSSEFTSDDLIAIKDAVKPDVDTIMAATEGKKAKEIAESIDTYSDDILTSLKSITGVNNDHFRCGINKKNNVYCWGNNSAGILGELYPKDTDGKPVESGFSVIDNFSATPVAVKMSNGTLLSNVKQIDAGSSHVCAVTYDGQLYCWGGNWQGQAGIGEVTSTPVLYAARVVKGKQSSSKTEYLSDVESVAANSSSTCALIKDGSLYCWGDNTVMQLGNSLPEDEHLVGQGVKSREGIDLSNFLKAVPYPVQVAFPNTVTAVKEIIPGYWSFCALVENKDTSDLHNVYCWGDDIYGLVSHDWTQYQNDFVKKYSKVLMSQDQSALADPTGKQPWYWHIWDEYGTWYPLYGAPVNQIASVASVRTADKVWTLEADTDSASVPKAICDIKSWMQMNENFSNNLKSSIAGVSEHATKDDGSSSYALLNGSCDSKNQDACSVEAVWFSYVDDNQNPKTVLATCDENNSNWTEDEIYTAPGFDRNTQSISWIGVNTAVKINKIDELELTNVTKLAITGFDGQMTVERDNSSVLHALGSVGENGTSY
ncbi:MAG: hypothetical protein IJ523_06205 [Succinivibrionaceae bacterium]|nr:hypothetical protein [Succinivibrionaceae bacterium]